MLIHAQQHIKMSELEARIKIISDGYTKLKKCQSAKEKLAICQQITNHCVEAEAIIEKMNHSQDKFKYSRQIAGIKEKVLDITSNQRKKLLNKKHREDGLKEPEGKRDPLENEGDRMSQDEMCRKIVRTIIEQEISWKHLSVSNQELEQLVVKMQQNLSVMEEIKNLVQDQGNNFHQVEGNIIKAYDNTVQANQELEDAAQIQLKTRLKKIRLGFAGVFGAVGYFFLGIPGALASLIGAVKLPKLLKTRN